MDDDDGSHPGADLERCAQRALAGGARLAEPDSGAAGGGACIVGIWLSAAPLIFWSPSPAAYLNGNQITGALIVTVAVIAMGEPIRSVRFFNIVLGLWLITAPWVLSGAGTGSTVNSVLAGLLLVGLSIPRGVVRERFGDWDRYVR